MNLTFISFGSFAKHLCCTSDNCCIKIFSNSDSGMLRGTYWTLISVLLLILSVNIEGNKRREKPSRWKEAVDNDNEGKRNLVIVGGYLKTINVRKQKKYWSLEVSEVVFYPNTFKFTYSLQYDESCDCQRSVLSKVSQSHRDVETLQPPYIRMLKIKNIDKREHRELSKKDKMKLAELQILLKARDKRGALMVISSDYQPICDDEFNDRTAIALCQLHGFETGRRTSMSFESRQLAFRDTLMGRTEDKIKDKIYQNGIVHFDSWRFHCFCAASITHHPGQAHNDLGKDSTNTTLDTHMLNATNNISIADSCSELRETHVACSRNQAAAVFCHNNDPPFLQFYNIEIHVGLTKFYITFNARYVKLGRIYEYFEDFPKSNDVMPKRSDFSATMCGRKVPLDLETTREMGKGRHLVFLGKFLKKCEECVRMKFKDYVIIFEDALFICKLKGERTKENASKPKSTKEMKSEDLTREEKTRFKKKEKRLKKKRKAHRNSGVLIDLNLPIMVKNQK